MDYYLTVDVGGTGIKAAALSPEGTFLIAPIRRNAMAKADAAVIYQNFLSLINTVAAAVPSGTLKGLAFAFPGPFDYGKGISLMEGIGKYDAIKGTSIKQGICSQRGGEAFTDIPFFFLNDVEAFALGLPDEEKRRTLCVCIGTGTGSAFLVDGDVVKKAGDGVPEHGWIYNIPYKESIIDDYLSARGQSRLAVLCFGRDVDGRELERLAQESDERALRVFTLFGDDLAQALAPIIDAFHPKDIVFGGQISKSFAHFGKQISTLARERKIDIRVRTDTSELIMQGLVQRMRKNHA